MFKFLKKNKPEATPEAQPQTPDSQTYNSGLKKTRGTLGKGISNLLLGKVEITPELCEALETQLLLADIGVDTTKELMQQVTDTIKRKHSDNIEQLSETLKSCMVEMLAQCEKPLEITDTGKPFVILMVGINGAGKTTTIGKITHQLKDQGCDVMLAAGDTFRAAAVEQLQTWGERNNVPVIAQATGSDSASVVFDALSSATAKNMNVLIADTAGRLHTADNLMSELAKVKRVMKKIDENAPHETLLVIDASNGQNALIQAEQFNQDIGLTGICITKLDGTAKGGIVLAIAKKLGLPIRYIGIGEGITDLKPFSAKDFVDALFEESKQQA